MNITIKNISKTFKEQSVLSNITAEFHSGHIYGIIGRNGSGKTVLLKCICGLMQIDSGEIFYNDQLLKEKMDMIPNTGIIIEHPAFLDNYCGLKNLEYLYTIRNKKNKKHLEQTMLDVGLDPKSKKKVKNYSVGMKQRLGIAQAIMENPSVLLLDEPMTGLDAEGMKVMRQLFLRLKKEDKLILIASHYKDDIDLLCDTVYQIMDSNLIRLR